MAAKYSPSKRSLTVLATPGTKAYRKRQDQCR